MPGNADILIVEDESDIGSMLEFALADDYQVTLTTSGKQAWQYLETSTPDIVLLDWMLPDISGIELLRRIRRDARLKQMTVIMLTARGEESDRVHGLDSGADDYVTKPFSTRELRARIRSRLRTRSEDNDGSLEINGVILDQAEFRVTANDMELELGPTEFKLLRHFMKHPERVFSRGQLLDQVWGPNVFIEERTVDVHIRRLRKALEPAGKQGLVQTVRGAGYRLSEKP